MNNKKLWKIVREENKQNRIIMNAQLKNIVKSIVDTAFDYPHDKKKKPNLKKIMAWLYKNEYELGYHLHTIGMSAAALISAIQFPVKKPIKGEKDEDFWD